MATVIETAIPAPHVEGTHSGTLAEMVARMSGREGTAIRYPRDGIWHEISFAGVARAASEIAGGLIALGIEPGDKVSILSGTRPEWTLADFGAVAAATTVVPVYHTNSPEECAYVLGHSEARAVVCENAEQLAIGALAAVLIDGLIVRPLLLPVAMRLLGHWSWWMPRWLNRMLPTAHFGAGRHAH